MSVMISIAGFLFYIFVLVFSVIIHEVSHGLIAKRLGDDTAEMAGRLTLNPIPHIDPFGSIILPILLRLFGLPGIAWARPVPYNPHKLYKDYRYGPLKVALAGPLSNILIAIVFSILARLAGGFLNPMAIGLMGLVALFNCFLAIFNLLPIPPLDGSKILPLIFPKYANAIERVNLLGILFVFLFIYLFSGIVSVIAEYAFALLAGGRVVELTLRAFAILFPSSL